MNVHAETRAQWNEFLGSVAANATDTRTPPAKDQVGCNFLSLTIRDCRYRLDKPVQLFHRWIFE
jgi:hypothetical protein